MSRKQDRFEAMVEKEMALTDGWSDVSLTKEQVVTLLRREHQALVRAVKRLLSEADGFLGATQFERGYLRACEDVLALLAKRKGVKTCP